MMSAIDIFVRLGQRLRSFGHDEASLRAINRAIAENGWFSAHEALFAVEAIRSQMLIRAKLEAWLQTVPAAPSQQKRVAIVMAGNIPLAGFFDLLCVLVCGHRAIVKPSGKDTALIHYIITLLRDIEPETPVEETDDAGLYASAPDAVIATGGDNAVRLFRYRFGGIPLLLRGSRHSVAVLDGRETNEERCGLLSDISLYSGLGCRNVSMMFVPRGMKLRLSVSSVNVKLRNNYLQTKAMLTMRGAPFTDVGGLLLVPSMEFPSALSTVSLAVYDDIEEVREWLASHDSELQCVVTHCIDHPRAVPFGAAQRPRLNDYPDGMNVPEFLASL